MKNALHYPFLHNKEHIHLSIVVPLYNEKANVFPLVARIHNAMLHSSTPWELILIDDGSSDGTEHHLQRIASHYGQHIRLLRFRRNFGQTAAMQAGFDAARGELIATLDGDLQNDPADIPRLMQDLLTRDLDLLQGWRQQRQDHVLRTMPSRLANYLIGQVTGLKLHDYGCSLKIYRTAVVRDIRLFGEMHRFIPVWMAMITDPQRIGETPVSHQARQFGTSNYGLSRTFRVILDLLVAFFFLRFGARPSHFFGTIGLTFGAIGTVMMSHLLIVKFILGEDIGQRPLLLIAILFLLTAIQFLTTGVLAELLARTFFASSQHTHYRCAWQSDPTQATWKTNTQK
jgi:glycosyltransferase involved in cell wall biosynthesis